MTRRQLFIAQLICILFLNQRLPAQTLNQSRLNESTLSADGDFRTAASGYWNKDSTWARFAGGAWITPATPPDSGAGVIIIRSGHVVTINSSILYDQVMIESGGQVIVALGVSHTLADGPGNDLTINGTWLNQGGSWSVVGSARWAVNDGGVYVHNTTGSISTPLSKAILSRSSTFVYRGSSGLVPASSFSGRTYGNLQLESTGGVLALSASGSGSLTINGGLVIGAGVRWGTGGFSGNISVGGDTFLQGEWSGSGSGSLGIHTFGGTFTIGSVGKYTLATTGHPQGNLVYQGDILCHAPFLAPAGRNLELSSIGLQKIAGGAKITLTNGANAEGDVEITSGSMIEIGPGKILVARRGLRLSGSVAGADSTSRLVFSGNDTLTANNGEATVPVFFAGGTGTKYLTGAGAWSSITIDSTCSARIAGRHVFRGEGTPFIVRGIVELDTGSTVIYSGTSRQTVTPLTFANLVIDNSSELSLSGATTVRRRLEVRNGILKTTTYRLLLGTDASVEESGSGSVIGEVAATRILKPSVRESFGNLGIEIQSEGIPESEVCVTRVTGRPSELNAAFPILRYFVLEPSTPMRNARVWFHYAPSDIDGVFESRLELFGSNDGGSVWTRLGGEVDTLSNVVSFAGDCSYSRLLLAEPFPVPTIMGIEPSSAEQGSTVSLKISGSGFLGESPTLSFSGTGVRIISTTVLGSSSMTANVIVGENAPLGFRELRVTALGGASVFSDHFEVVKKRNPQPMLSSLAPPSGARLDSVLVTLHGSGFVPGLTSVSFGSDIGVEAVVLDADVLMARITIAESATPGQRDIRVANPEPGGGSSILQGAFSVVNPVPTVTGLSTTKAARGSFVDLVLSGANFIAGVTSVSFGSGIEVDSLIVLSNTKIRLRVRILFAAPLGSLDIAVTNAAPGGGRAVLSGALFVTDRPPSVTSIFPAKGVRGSSGTITLAGRGFVPGLMILYLGEGLVVDSLVVNDSCQLFARVRVARNAATGPRDLILANRGQYGESFILPGGFVVENPPPECSGFMPAVGALFQKLTVTFNGSGFIAGESKVDFGTGVNVDSTWSDSSGCELKAVISVVPEAGCGLRTVTLRNNGPGGGVATLPDAFRVVFPAPVLNAVSPASAYRGQSLEITLSGGNFVGGASLVSLLPGIRVDSLKVKSSSVLVAKITVAPDAVIGARTILVSNPAPGGGSARLPHVLNVENGAPSVGSVSPSFALRGESTALTISGDNFYVGSTSLDMGADIQVDSVWIESRTRLLAVVTPRIDAATELHDVRVTNPPPGGGIAVVNGSLAVLNPAPTLEIVRPNRGERGKAMLVVISGSRFIERATSVYFGEGISVESLAVKSRSVIEARIAIGVATGLGARSVSVINPLPGGGRAELVGGFDVVSTEVSSVAEKAGVVPATFFLADIYPNPFNFSSVVHFGLPERAAVRILVYNLLGHVVTTIFSGEHGPGSYRIPWIANDVPSGVYFIEMNAESSDVRRRFRAVKRAVYLK
ncbi:MAG: hypothetical protein HW389_1759 [Bacteroidetes bacterium]|nr:hypothetical protein [Bacteroidota bacterium]